jgi:hypothetical protein
LTADLSGPTDLRPKQLPTRRPAVELEVGRIDLHAVHGIAEHVGRVVNLVAGDALSNLMMRNRSANSGTTPSHST